VFVEQEVSADIRASAQGLFMTMVNGVGAYVGSILSGMAVDYFSSMVLKTGRPSGWYLPLAALLAVVFLLCFYASGVFLAVSLIYGSLGRHAGIKNNHRAWRRCIKTVGYSCAKCFASVLSV
jgi:hypothetical protein